MKKKIKDLLYKIKKKVLVSYYGFLTTIKILIDVLDSITRYLFRELIQATVCIIILFTIFGITITIYDFFFIPDILSFDEHLIEEMLRKPESDEKSSQGIESDEKSSQGIDFDRLLKQFQEEQFQQDILEFLQRQKEFEEARLEQERLEFLRLEQQKILDEMENESDKE